MTIQVGINGPPTTEHTWLRVWTDRASGLPVVRNAGDGGLVPNLTTRVVALPDHLVRPPTPRRLFEIRGWPTDRLLHVDLSGERATVLTPPGPDSELRLLLGSCFYRASPWENVGDAWDSFVRERPGDRPHIRIHCGDQLYLDPERLDNRPNEVWGTVGAYEKYWTHPGYKRFLAGGISLFTPDDHDFWNDYPYFMVHLDRSSSADNGRGQKKWEAHGDAARHALEAFQTLGHPDRRSYFELDLGLVSMFVMDTRSDRGDGNRIRPKRLFDTAQREALVAWGAGLTKPGVLVSASSLFQKARSKFLFATSDHNLLAFPADAEAIWRTVEEAPHDIVVLAGDLHQARLNRWRTGSGARRRQRYEFVSSPLSVLTWFGGGRPNADTPPRVQVGTTIKQAERTLWGLASRDNFGLIRLRKSHIAGGVKVRFELRSTAKVLQSSGSSARHWPGRVATSDYVQREDGRVVRSWPEGGRIPCTHEVELR